MHRLNSYKKKVLHKKPGRWMKIGILTAIMLSMATAYAFAATEDPVTGINNLKKLLASIVSAVGAIILLWSVVQLGIGIKKHDPAATSESLMGVAAGLIIACAPWVVTQI